MGLTPPIVLTIAGFDPSAGAGVTADLKTIAAHECYGVACVTALTVQSTTGVDRVEAVDPKGLYESLEALASDMTFDAIHVGMLGSGAAAKTVADFLSTYRPPNTVVDPVIRSSLGAKLLEDEGLKILIEYLLPQSQVITPNLSEASIMSGLEVSNEEQMRQAALTLHEMGAAGVVITGGHLPHPADLLSVRLTNQPLPDQIFFRSERIDSTSTHGTGCAFATSIACNLALGKSLTQSVREAQAYVLGAIKNAYPVGKGTGPINHFFRTKGIESPRI